MKQGWKNYLLYFGGTLVAGIIIYYLIQFILSGYPVAWTGFGDYTSPNGDYFREKTLWDWMELLIIPVVLAGGAILLNRSERALERKTAEDRAKLERDLATDRQQEAALQTYFDRMSELLLDKKLRTTNIKEVRELARTRTLSVLRGLDANRKTLLFEFLVEANLIGPEEPVVELQRVDLSGAHLMFAELSKTNLNVAHLIETDLRNANLSGARLIGAKLRSAKLNGAKLNGTDLRNADLSGATLEYTKLTDAKLRGVKLSGAKLRGADLSGANLSGADLSGVTLELNNLSGADLSNAKLSGAKLRGADLRGANLSGADLSYADLSNAKLSSANLKNADLSGADLSYADLSGAKLITDKQLAKVKSLKRATMPDGTKHG